jgi:hypothetical protein
VEGERAVSVSDAGELRFSEPSLISEVLVGKTKELNHRAVKSLAQLLGHRVDEHRLAHDPTVGKEVWLMGRHHHNSFIICLKRDPRIVMKRSDVFRKCFAFASHRIVRVNSVTNNNSRQFLQIRALIPSHESPKNMTTTSFGTSNQH